MSRQFDEYMEGKFELNGIEYSLIEPDTYAEFTDALQVKQAIQSYISGLMHDDDSSAYYDLLQTQEDYIAEYVERLGDFDNSKIAGNIAFFSKRNGVRIGELEKMLGISPGYISRTLKEGSGKKISIDIVWKIARLLGTDIRTLTEEEMWMPHTNTNLLVSFIQRLYADTRDNYFSWEYGGGLMVQLEERFLEMGLVTEEGDVVVYHPTHLNPEAQWIVPKDIFYIESFERNKDLVIIPYQHSENERLSGYDFIFAWEEDGEWKWEKVFYTGDDPFQHLREEADGLYELVEGLELDAKISPQVQKMITRYVTGGRPD